METRIHDRVPIYLKTGILFIFFHGIGTHSPSSEVRSLGSNFDSNFNSKIGITQSFRKHIMDSYFEKHKSYLDSDFKDFMASELPFGLCKVLPDNLNLVLSMSVLHRSLIGEGSHRHLSSSFRFNIPPDSISELPTHVCKVIIIERLPSGVFADPFELQHLVRRGVFTDVAVFGDTNLELPTVLSNRTVVEVHMEVGPNVLLRHQNGLEIKIELPLHARYPPLDEGGYSKVEFGAPDLFMHCSIEEDSHNQGCLFVSGNGSAESRSPVVWKIPAGTKADAGIVSVVTFISALLSTLSIVLTSIFSSASAKDLKQSYERPNWR